MIYRLLDERPSLAVRLWQLIRLRYEVRDMDRRLDRCEREVSDELRRCTDEVGRS